MLVRPPSRAAPRRRLTPPAHFCRAAPTADLWPPPTARCRNGRRNEPSGNSPPRFAAASICAAHSGESCGADGAPRLSAARGWSLGGGCARHRSLAAGCAAGRPLGPAYKFDERSHELALLTLARDAGAAPVCERLFVVRVPVSSNEAYCVALESAADTRTQAYAFEYDLTYGGSANYTLAEWVASDRPLPPRTVPVEGRWENGLVLPSKPILKEAYDGLGRLFSHHDELVRAFHKLLVDRQILRDEVWVVAANEGYMDLFYNWLCSAKEAGVIVRPYLVVVTTSESLAKELMDADITAFHHEAFGKYDAAPSTAYGHHGFNQMMHMKNVAVWLPLSLGKNVLFLDSDLVWFQDPMPTFRTGGDYDATFMGDATTARFSPFYGNTGFFYLRHSNLVRAFWHRVLTSMDMIHSAQSQQNPVNLYAGFMHSLGLSVRVLSRELIAGGETLLPVHWREQAKRYTKEWNPLALHENWTLNSTEKWSRIRRSGLSYTVEQEKATAAKYTCRPAAPPEDENLLKFLATRNITFAKTTK